MFLLTNDDTFASNYCVLNQIEISLSNVILNDFNHISVSNDIFPLF